MGRRRLYTREFKESAIELYHKSGKSAEEIAEGLGIHSANLTRWLRESKEVKSEKIRVFPGQGNPRDEEIAQYKKRMADLEETNEILSKALAYFAVKKNHR